MQSPRTDDRECAVHPEGAYEINIPSKIREQLLSCKKWDRTSFDEAKGETYKLLKRFVATASALHC